MVAIMMTLLLGLAIYLGLSWQPRSLGTYYAAVAAALAVWASSLAFWNTYTVMLPFVFGTLGSLLLALAGIRAAWRAHAAGDLSRSLWIGGVCAVLLPLVLLLLNSALR
jgi:hypothetical protein